MQEVLTATPELRSFPSRGNGRVGFKGFTPPGFELAERFLDGVIEIIICGVIERFERNVRRAGAAEKAGGANGLKADPRTLVISEHTEGLKWLVDSVSPIAQHSRRSRAGAGLGRFEQAFQKIGVDDVVPGFRPERFE